METVTLDFEYTKRDYVRGLRTQMFGTKRQRTSLKVLAVCAAVLVVAFLAVFLLSGPDHGTSAASGGTSGSNWLGLWLILFVAIMLFYYIGFPHLSYKSAKKVFGQCHMEISRAGLFTQTPSTRMDSDWVSYKEYWENKEFFFLIMPTRVFNMIPKRVCAPGQEAAIRGILSGALPYGKGRPKYKIPGGRL